MPETFSNESKEIGATDFKILLQRKDVVLPKDRELVAQIHGAKRGLTPTGKPSFEVERRGAHHHRLGRPGSRPAGSSWGTPGCDVAGDGAPQDRRGRAPRVLERRSGGRLGSRVAVRTRRALPFVADDDRVVALRRAPCITDRNDYAAIPQIR